MNYPTAPPELAQALQRLSEAVGQFQAALIPLAARVREAMVDLNASLRPLAEYLDQNPEVLHRQRTEAQEGTCHCLCQATHGTLGICTTNAEPGLTVAFRSTTAGTWHVPFCGPCFDAHQATLAK